MSAIPGSLSVSRYGAPEVAVHVADPDAAVVGGLGHEVGEVDLLDVPVAADRVGQRLLRGRRRVLDQAVGGEDRQAGILERDEAHEHPAGLGRSRLLGVHARGLVAVVAVGDQQLGRRDGVHDLGEDRRVGHAPEPVGVAVVVGDLGPRRGAHRPAQRRGGAAGGVGEQARTPGTSSPGSPASGAGGPPWAPGGCARAGARGRRRRARCARGTGSRGGRGRARRARGRTARAPRSPARRRA